MEVCACNLATDKPKARPVLRSWSGFTVAQPGSLSRLRKEVRRVFCLNCWASCVFFGCNFHFKGRVRESHWHLVVKSVFCKRMIACLIGCVATLASAIKKGIAIKPADRTTCPADSRWLHFHFHFIFRSFTDSLFCVLSPFFLMSSSLLAVTLEWKKNAKLLDSRWYKLS